MFDFQSPKFAIILNLMDMFAGAAMAFGVFTNGTFHSRCGAFEADSKVQDKNGTALKIC
jgi:hypothetical protein